MLKTTRRNALVMLMLITAAPYSLAEEKTVPESNPYEEARFTVSNDPTKAVLTVSISSNDFTEQSVILYGDGRLEIKDNRKGEWTRTLGPDEMQAIFSTAVVHGLAEWDSETILARQQHKYGRPFPGFTDASRVRILLSLENYERGSYKPGNVFRSIAVQAPGRVFKYYPEIIQFDGAAKLAAWMHDQVTQPREEADKVPGNSWRIGSLRRGR